MKGDWLYCRTCGAFYHDMEDYYDTRDGLPKAVGHDGKVRVVKGHGKITFQPRCPHCHGFYVSNASVILEQGDELTKLPGGIKNWKDSSLYKFYCELRSKQK